MEKERERETETHRETETEREREREKLKPRQRQSPILFINSLLGASVPISSFRRKHRKCANSFKIWFKQNLFIHCNHKFNK